MPTTDIVKCSFDGDDLSSRAALASELTATLGRPFDSQAWSILAEAQLRDPGRRATARYPGDESPLPAGACSQGGRELSSPYINAQRLNWSAWTECSSTSSLHFGDGRRQAVSGAASRKATRSSRGEARLRRRRRQGWAFASCLITARRRERLATRDDVGWAGLCSISTATVGSTSTAFRGAAPCP